MWWLGDKSITGTNMVVNLLFTRLSLAVLTGTNTRRETTQANMKFVGTVEFEEVAINMFSTDSLAVRKNTRAPNK